MASNNNKQKKKKKKKKTPTKVGGHKVEPLKQGAGNTGKNGPHGSTLGKKKPRPNSHGGNCHRRMGQASKQKLENKLIDRPRGTGVCKAGPRHGEGTFKKGGETTVKREEGGPERAQKRKQGGVEAQPAGGSANPNTLPRGKKRGDKGASSVGAAARKERAPSPSCHEKVRSFGSLTSCKKKTIQRRGQKRLV